MMENNKIMVMIQRYDEIYYVNKFTTLSAL